MLVLELRKLRTLIEFQTNRGLRLDFVWARYTLNVKPQWRQLFNRKSFGKFMKFRPFKLNLEVVEETDIFTPKIGKVGRCFVCKDMYVWTENRHFYPINRGISPLFCNQCYHINLGMKIHPDLFC